MKKKILLVLMVVVLALTMTAGLVACKKDTKVEDKKVEQKDDTGSTGDDKKALTNDDVAYVLGEVIASAEDIVGDLNKASDTYYADATVFGSYNGTEFDLRAAGTLDAKTAGNNKALVNVAVAGDDLVTLYLSNDTLYVGEALLQEEFSWVKFDQVADDKLTTYLMKQMPAEASKVLAGIDLSQYTSMVKGFLPMIANLGMFELSAPSAYDKDAAVLADGTYAFNIKMSELSGLLDILKTTGIDLKATINSLPEAIAPIVNTAVEVVFGGDIDSVLAGTVKNYPDIALSFDFKGGNIAGLALSYVSEALVLDGNDLGAVDLKLGVKDLVISKDSTADIAPAVNLSKVERAAVKANVAVSAPEFEVNAEQNVLDLNLGVYVYPSIKMGFSDKDGFDLSKFYLDVSTASAVVIAKNGDTTIAAADYIAANKEFRIDLNTFYSYLGYYTNTKQLKGYFDISKAITGYEDFYYDSAKNAEKAPSDNPIDAIYDVVANIIKDGFAIGDIFGYVDAVRGNVEAIANDIIDSKIFAVNADELSFSISINDLAKYIVDEEGIIATSTVINDNLPINLADYASVEDIVALIAGLVEMDDAEVWNLVKIVAGDNADADYIQNCKVVFSAIRGAKDGDGIGFGIAIKDATGKDVVSVKVTLDIFAANEIETSAVSGQFAGQDLYTRDGATAALSTFGEDMKCVLLNLFGLGE